MSHAEQIGLILGGVILLSIIAAFVAYRYDNPKSARPTGKRRTLDPSSGNLQEWSRKLGIEFDPKDPNDPLVALIAAGEYFRMPGCEPGGPHYDETFQRVLLMIEQMVPPDRFDFWTEQVHRLYGSKFLLKQYKKK